jgi:U3 small nucleolar RNA-associated protein 23
VATQDKALQAALARVPGAPVVFASVNGIHLSEPSETARALVAGGAAAAQALPLHELATEALHDLHELRPRDEGYKKFRRKHAKGPNPLAVKAKKKRPAPGGSSKEGGGGGGGAQQRPPQEGAEGGGGGGEEGAAAKRKRKRKKGKAAGDGGGGGSD